MSDVIPKPGFTRWAYPVAALGLVPEAASAAHPYGVRIGKTAVDRPAESVPDWGAHQKTCINRAAEFVSRRHASALILLSHSPCQRLFRPLAPPNVHTA